MEFRILGPVEAHTVRGRAVDLGPGIQRCILAVLLVDANHVLPADTLISRVWQDAYAHRASFYSYISRLRSALAADEDVAIVRRSGGYQLTVDLLAVDLHRFRHLVEVARESADPEHAVAQYEQGLRLWRGEAFAGLDTQWLSQLRVPLETERRTAELARNDLMLRLGRHAELVAELAASVAAHPLDERLAGQFMLALHRAGRRAQALQVYQDTRAALVAELGLEPGPELHQLHQEILADEATGAGRADAVTVRTRQLPADVTHFTGRERHLAEVCRLLDRPRRAAPVVVAIDGMAGVGKTTLAVHLGHMVADRFPDGQLYVDLRGYALTPPMTTAEALGRLLRGLNLPPDRIPHDEDEMAAVYRSMMAGKQMLVVLDNAKRDEQVRALLPGTPGCLVLVTSRTNLSTLDNTEHVHLTAFSERDALALLARLAGRERVEREQSAARAVVRMCARLPLAVRIAGARLAARPAWQTTTLAHRLADRRQRLDELKAGDLAVGSSFAASLRALDTSDDSVDRAAARMFRLLGVLDWIDISVPVAAALLDRDEAEAREALERLVDDHLLDSAAPGRYHAHDLLRLYARGIAVRDESDEHRQNTLDRVLRCCLDAAEQANALVNPNTIHVAGPTSCVPRGRFVLVTQADATAWADTERANLVALSRQALGTAGNVGALVVRLTAALHRLFDLRGYWQDAVVMRELTLAAAQRSGDQAAAASALQDVAWTYVRLGRSEPAIDAAQRALDIRRGTADARGEQACLNILGFALRQEGRLQEALDCLNEAHAICQRIDHSYGAKVTLNNLGLVHQHLGDFDSAVDCHEQALKINEDMADRYGQAVALANLGWAYVRSGDPLTAMDRFDQSLTITEAIGDRYQQAETLWGLGTSHHELGNHEQARACWHQSVAILRAIGTLGDDQAATLTGTPVPDTPEIIRRNI